MSRFLTIWPHYRGKNESRGMEWEDVRRTSFYFLFPHLWARISWVGWIENNRSPLGMQGILGQGGTWGEDCPNAAAFPVFSWTSLRNSMKNRRCILFFLYFFFSFSLSLSLYLYLAIHLGSNTCHPTIFLGFDWGLCMWQTSSQCRRPFHC